MALGGTAAVPAGITIGVGPSPGPFSSLSSWPSAGIAAAEARRNMAANRAARGAFDILVIANVLARRRIRSDVDRRRVDLPDPAALVGPQRVEHAVRVRREARRVAALVELLPTRPRGFAVVRGTEPRLREAARDGAGRPRHEHRRRPRAAAVAREREADLRVLLVARPPAPRHGDDAVLADRDRRLVVVERLRGIRTGLRVDRGGRRPALS